ncbi:DUF2797 domain-containing protein [Kitasatospora sp. NPDC056273]|uniref:DUF2797 domain-containing protein n=1 Tax=Kitasatospora sp. NPDC056273 TaxID=3345769 RepID=UPI0035D9012C
MTIPPQPPQTPEHRARPAGWVSTGLSWRDGRAVLGAARGAQVHERAVAPGVEVGWLLGGPRRCVGAWLVGATERTACPHHAVIDPGGGATQCPACQSVDRGLALARDQILDDGRTYLLYLAWFGEGLLKVGLTAEQRGDSRLLEQGALAYAFTARGALPAVRRAELTVAASGLARERYKSRIKTEQWWSHGDVPYRRTVLGDARARAHRLLDGHAVELLADRPVVDHVERYGLAGGAPEAYREIAGLADGAVLAGRLRAPVGRHLFLDQTDGSGPLLLDTRLLTGWTLSPVTGRGSEGLVLQERLRPPEPDTQEALF